MGGRLGGRLGAGVFLCRRARFCGNESRRLVWGAGTVTLGSLRTGRLVLGDSSVSGGTAAAGTGRHSVGVICRAALGMGAMENQIWPGTFVAAAGAIRSSARSALRTTALTWRLRRRARSSAGWISAMLPVVISRRGVIASVALYSVPDERLMES